MRDHLSFALFVENIVPQIATIKGPLRVLKKKKTSGWRAGTLRPPVSPP